MVVVLRRLFNCGSYLLKLISVRVLGFKRNYVVVTGISTERILIRETVFVCLRIETVI
jgi:hypothetical protein